MSIYEEISLFAKRQRDEINKEKKKKAKTGMCRSRFNHRERDYVSDGIAS